MNRILLIQPLKYWNLNGARVYVADEVGDTVEMCGRVTPESLSEDESKLAFLLRACDGLEEGNLYRNFGARTYRKQQTFWEDADEKLKHYVVMMASKHLADCIRRAEELGMPVYYRNGIHADVYSKDVLTRQDEVMVPVMSFIRTEQGMDYRLSVRLGNRNIVPCRCNLDILAYDPPIVVMNNGMYRMPEGFSARLLIPFMTKEKTSIPQRMQNEYFRKFIITNAVKADVHVEGFDVEDKEADKQCLMCLEHSLGKAVVVLRYKYDNRQYEIDSVSKAMVRLVEDGDAVKMERVSRDFVWEEKCRNSIAACVPGWETAPDGRVAAKKLFATMDEAVKWVADVTTELKSLEPDVQFVQNTGYRYYVGKYDLQKSKTWLGDWLNIRVALVLADGTKIPFRYFRRAIVEGDHEVELPNGEMFIIPDEWFAEYGGLLMIGVDNGDFIKVHRSQLGALDNGVFADASEASSEDVRVIDADNGAPDALKATLRSYQQQGFEWLCANLNARTGCCLADDMGLGKTVQTIALLLKYKELAVEAEQPAITNGMLDLFTKDYGVADTSASFSRKACLIVCPSSLVFNWENELRRFAPSLMVCNYTGSISERRKKFEALSRWDVVITTYRTATNDIDDICAIEFGIVVFDESQVFKNRTSQLYAAMLRIRADHHVALSGTPMENALPELWSLMNVLNPLILGDFSVFKHNFINPIKEDLMDVRTRILRSTIAPYFLRRTKEQVLVDLPERQDETVVCEMTDEQYHVYEEELSMARNMVTGGDSNEMSVLAAIGRLRQIANHPHLVGLSEGGVDLSGKTSAVFTHLESLRGTEHKVLLFSEYVSFLELISAEMDRRGWDHEVLTGESRNREQIIKNFNDDAECQFFLVSLKAGGVGLNLTCADYVFLLNPWWNKAAEEQAISRAHRLGQRRSVFVYRFVTSGTLEEKILQLQDYKQSLIDAVMPFIVSSTPASPVRPSSQWHNEE